MESHIRYQAIGSTVFQGRIPQREKEDEEFRMKELRGRNRRSSARSIPEIFAMFVFPVSKLSKKNPTAIKFLKAWAFDAKICKEWHTCKVWMVNDSKSTLEFRAWHDDGSHARAMEIQIKSEDLYTRALSASSCVRTHLFAYGCAVHAISKTVYCIMGKEIAEGKFPFQCYPLFSDFYNIPLKENSLRKENWIFSRAWAISRCA